MDDYNPDDEIMDDTDMTSEEAEWAYNQWVREDSQWLSGEMAAAEAALAGGDVTTAAYILGVPVEDLARVAGS